MGCEPRRARRRCLAAAALTAAALGLAAVPALAASRHRSSAVSMAYGPMGPSSGSGGRWWWPPLPLRLTAVASSPSTRTLAISRGRAGWLRPLTGSFRPLRSAGAGPARAVAMAAGGEGCIVLRSGRTVFLGPGGRLLGTAQLPGGPAPAGTAVALAAGAGGPLAVVATPRGLVALRPGRPANTLLRGDATAVVPPAATRHPWWALVGGELAWSRSGTSWAPVPRAPRFAASTHVLAALVDGTVLVAEPSGLVWSRTGQGWARVLQLLPAGGLSSVPEPTALQAVNVSSAYLATDGFGALLTPDDGYGWYRAAPSQLPATVDLLATVGPVRSATRPRGLVLAAGPRGLSVHALQPLPTPPAYQGATQTAEELGTAAVTLAAIALAAGALWLGSRRRPGTGATV